MWKNIVESDRPKMAISACGFHATHQKLQTHTLSACNTYYFSTATVAARTLLNVLYITCLASFIYYRPHMILPTDCVVQRNIFLSKVQSRYFILRVIFFAELLVVEEIIAG
jgi:hypothetical protein